MLTKDHNLLLSILQYALNCKFKNKYSIIRWKKNICSDEQFSAYSYNIFSKKEAENLVKFFNEFFKIDIFSHENLDDCHLKIEMPDHSSVEDAWQKIKSYGLEQEIISPNYSKSQYRMLMSREQAENELRNNKAVSLILRIGTTKRIVISYMKNGHPIHINTQYENIDIFLENYVYYLPLDKLNKKIMAFQKKFSCIDPIPFSFIFRSGFCLKNDDQIKKQYRGEIFIEEVEQELLHTEIYSEIISLRNFSKPQIVISEKVKDKILHTTTPFENLDVFLEELKKAQKNFQNQFPYVDNLFYKYTANDECSLSEKQQVADFLNAICELPSNQDWIFDTEKNKLMLKGPGRHEKCNDGYITSNNSYQAFEDSKASILSKLENFGVDKREIKLLNYNINFVHQDEFTSYYTIDSYNSIKKIWLASQLSEYRAQCLKTNFTFFLSATKELPFPNELKKIIFSFLS